MEPSKLQCSRLMAWCADASRAGCWTAGACVARAGAALGDAVEEACAAARVRQVARTPATDASPGPTPRWIRSHIWESRARSALSTQLTSLCESFRYAACAASALALGTGLDLATTVTVPFMPGWITQKYV